MSEKRLQDLIENIPEVFWIFDWKKQQLLYLSPAYEDIWCRDGHDLQKNTGEWVESIHPADRKSALQSFQEIHKTGHVSHEYRIIRPDGSVRWISNKGSAVYGEDGSATQLVGIAADITERKRHEIIQTARYNIASAMVTATRQEMLFEKIHSELAPLLETKNLYLTLYNSETGLLNSPVISGKQDYHRDDKYNP